MPNCIAQKKRLATTRTSSTRSRLEVNLRTSRNSRWQLRIKRLIDVVGSLVLMLVLLPLFLIAALLVGCTSPGGVIFAQKRWGLRERHFVCYKLRSMHINADPLEMGRQKGVISGELLKLRNDPRVTPFGSLIRKWSIDELPQLFNVLRGDMSLVGPRPLVLHMMAPYPEIRKWRCAVRPGITGLWQLRNRENNTSVLHMVRDDLEYIDKWSLSLDLRILIATLPAVLHGRGAH